MIDKFHPLYPAFHGLLIAEDAAQAEAQKIWPGPCSRRRFGW